MSVIFSDDFTVYVSMVNDKQYTMKKWNREEKQ